MQKAWRAGNVPAGSLNYGSVVETIAYDGLGRRIAKSVQNSADLDATYHYYLDGQSVVEVRNGSDVVLKQYVWGNLASGGGMYVDELVQVAINGDPLDDPDFDSSDPDHDFRGLWAMQDANYNVLGLVEPSGGGGSGGADLVERYEYTPYGGRTVFFSPGSNDPLCYSATSISRRVVWSGSGLWQPYGLLEPGHQGLHHDEELLSGEIVYNRARHLHTTLGRFMQRDPLGYVDGMTTYAYLQSAPIGRLDPSGMYQETQEAHGYKDGEAGTWYHIYERGWPIFGGYFTHEYVRSYFIPDPDPLNNLDTAHELCLIRRKGLRELGEMASYAGDTLEITQYAIVTGVIVITPGPEDAIFAAALSRVAKRQGLRIIKNTIGKNKERAALVKGNDVLKGAEAAKVLREASRVATDMRIARVKRQAGISPGQPSIARGRVRNPRDGGYTYWWEYPSNSGEVKVVLVHSDGSAHAGRLKPTSQHHGGQKAPDYYGEASEHAGYVYKED